MVSSFFCWYSSAGKSFTKPQITFNSLLCTPVLLHLIDIKILLYFKFNLLLWRKYSVTRNSWRFIMWGDALRLNNGPRTGFTFLQSSIKERAVVLFKFPVLISRSLLQPTLHFVMRHIASVYVQLYSTHYAAMPHHHTFLIHNATALVCGEPIPHTTAVLA